MLSDAEHADGVQYPAESDVYPTRGATLGSAKMFQYFLLIATLYIFIILMKPRKYPPGPRWWPYVGCLPEFKRLTRKYGGQHLAAKKLAEDYKTNVLGLKLVQDRYCIVFTEELVRKVLCSEDYEGRPRSFFMRLRTMGSRNGITGVDGPLWQEHRQFTMRHLRNVGFGKPIMEEYIIEELSQLIKTFSENKVNVQITELISPHVINVLWMFTAGKRIDNDDARLALLLRLLRERTKAFDMAGGLLNLFPWMRFILPEWSGYNLINRLNEQFRVFFTDAINEHRKIISVVDEDLIHTFLSEMKERENDKDNTFTDEQLLMVCLDLFIAGSQTTSNSIDFAFLIMLLYPDIQRKVQAELDKVLMNRTPCLEDRNLLPYTMAVLHECQRYFNIVPLTGPRRAVRDTSLDGYIIPKNTVVLISLYSVHMDPEIFKDPEQFNPERFLKSDGQLNEKAVDKLMPFGLGRRRCLGEALARGSLFLFFTGIMQRFNIKPNNGVIPNIKPSVGITISPPKYTANIVPRQEYRARQSEI